MTQGPSGLSRRFRKLTDDVITTKQRACPHQTGHALHRHGNSSRTTGHASRKPYRHSPQLPQSHIHRHIVLRQNSYDANGNKSRWQHGNETKIRTVTIRKTSTTSIWCVTPFRGLRLTPSAATNPVPAAAAASSRNAAAHDTATKANNVVQGHLSMDRAARPPRLRGRRPRSLEGQLCTRNTLTTPHP